LKEGIREKEERNAKRSIPKTSRREKRRENKGARGVDTVKGPSGHRESKGICMCNSLFSGDVRGRLEMGGEFRSIRIKRADGGEKS